MSLGSQIVSTVVDNMVERDCLQLSYTIEEAAEAFDVSARSIRFAIDVGDLKARAIGQGKKNRSYRICVFAIINWLMPDPEWHVELNEKTGA